VSAREQFLAGERPDDVALFLADGYLSDGDALAEHGERVDGGVVLVVDGDRGRAVFQRATGMDAMGFARRADREGRVARDLTGGDCPEADEENSEEHAVQFVFAFAEEQNEEAGGRYAEGDVVHAYAYCTCSTAYSERWVAGE
jgi:hypothetical protein